MALTRRALGTTGMEITTVGFGAWAVGGGDWAYGWGPQEDDASIAAIRHAVESGVNWVDTAAIYGLGHSEEVVGRALRALPEGDRPYVFTKGGMIPDRERPYDEPVRNCQPASIRREVDASLARLGVERIDLYQFHWPDDSGTPVEDSWGELGRLVDEGKVAHAGVCNYDVDLLQRAEAARHVETLQPPFSLIRRGAGADVIPWAAEHGTGVIVYSPMQAGILTDSFSTARVAAFADHDWRRRNPEFLEPALSRNIALRDALRPLAERRGTTVSAIALGWVTAWPGVTAAIVGARNPGQVDGWLDAGRIELTGDEMTVIERALATTGAGSGPARPAAPVTG
jgi:aryl-alcohol dehydrogenase-like predicted oxidoreductase